MGRWGYQIQLTVNEGKITWIDFQQFAVVDGNYIIVK